MRCSENIVEKLGLAFKKLALLAILTGLVGCVADVSDRKAVSKAGYEETETRELTSKIAFVSNRNGNNEIYIVNPDGSNLKNITTNKASDTFPAWSPNGKSIAFQSDRDGNPEIYIMNSDGSNVEKITSNAIECNRPAWSPDGERIAYDVTQNGGLYIHLMKADGSESVRLGEGMSPTWSPDGKKIAFNRGQLPQIYIMDSDGENAELLSKPPSDVSEITQEEWMTFVLPNLSPVWSPDGQKILFTRVMPGATEDPKNSGMNYDVFTMNTKGEDQRRLTVTPGSDGGEDWSPDSKEIVFTSDRDGNMEIYVMNTDGTNKRRLTDDSATDSFPSWSPILSYNSKGE